MIGTAAGVYCGVFGVDGGVVSERTLEVTFAWRVLFVAYRLVRRSFAASEGR